jgi:short-subunit dehydrogenase
LNLCPRAEWSFTASSSAGFIAGIRSNAGSVRAGRLKVTTETEIEAMLTIDLLAPIMLTRAALPSLRASGDAVVVNVTFGIALIGAPFYATYAAAKAGLARFSEALRRELKGPRPHCLSRRH